MNEGEFKKRMVRFRLKFGLDAIIPDFVPRMLDDARKEFPFKTEMALFDKDKTIEIYQAYMTKLLTWFLKWFGVEDK
jgi:hypothetical protein